VGERWERWALPAILAVAALNFFWQLGSSSYYVDEVLSIEHALPSLGNVLSAVRTGETTPWTFFVFLHEWLYRTGSQAEWVTRLPSAVAGVALVAAVYWMAGAFLDRRPALLAAALCALSPLVLEYAQQVRMYVFLMLAVTIAVGATVRAGSASAGSASAGSASAGSASGASASARAAAASPHRTRLLVLGAAAAVLSLWLHYAAAAVILPLCVWLGTRANIPWRSRAAFIGACLVAEVLLLPLAKDQYNEAPNGLVGIAGITWSNVVRIAETPLDSRVLGGVDVIRLLGVAAVVGSVLILALRGRSAVRSRGLLVTLALLAPVAVVILGIAGKDVVLTRYTSVAAPFLITAIAAAVAVLPRAGAALLVTATLIVAGVGLVASHQRTGFYPPSREVISYIHAHELPGDVVLTPGAPGTDIPLDYYGQRLLHPLPEFIAASNTTQVNAAIARRQRVWYIEEIPNYSFTGATLLGAGSALFRARGYRAVSARTFTATTTFVVLLATPIRRQ